MSELQRREHVLSHLLTMRPDLADEVVELYLGESDEEDPRALLRARGAIDDWRGRLRRLCFEQLSDIDIERLLEEYASKDGDDR